MGVEMSKKVARTAKFLAKLRQSGPVSLVVTVPLVTVKKMKLKHGDDLVVNIEKWKGLK